MDENLEKLKFPIGKFQSPEVIDSQQISEWIQTIADFPENIKHETSGLNNKDLEKTYRPGGWTIRQIVHHCADSHMNSLMRFKLALTEDTPTIKPYHENLWAELSDSKLPIETSVKIIEGIHARWTNLLRNLSDNDLERQFLHPETNMLTSLKTNIGIYAWHCDHHLAHILNAKRR